MRCDTLGLRLAAEVDGAFDTELDLHAQTCLVCQADRARYRRLARMLTDLRDQPGPVAEGLLDDILDALDDRSVHARSHAGRRTVCTIAAAAGAAGALVLANRARVRRLAG